MKVLIYDGKCEYCKSWVDWASQRGALKEIEFISCQSQERKQRFPQILESECAQAMMVVLPDGKILSGGDAVPQFLSSVRGWRWTTPLFKIPGVLMIVRPIYRWIARNRHRMKFGKSVCSKGRSPSGDGSYKSI
jgi:predicted DCC family thiol-disulfide oxidoreductase YuxK